MLLTCYYLIFKEKNVPKKNDRIFLVLHRNEIYNSRAVTQCLAFPQLRHRTELSLWPVSHRCVLETPLERWIVLLSLVRTIQIMSPYVGHSTTVLMTSLNRWMTFGELSFREKDKRTFLVVSSFDRRFLAMTWVSGYTKKGNSIGKQNQNNINVKCLCRKFF